MMKASKLVMILAGASLLGCGGPGLPPAGPKPGEVDVGYGTQPAEKVTGAVTSVSDKEGKTSGQLQIAELLRGKVAGLQIINRPDGTFSFRIRGGADQEPLVVVDGTPVDIAHLTTALAGLTSDDIRQVEVLKDVASTSIYGIRGAAGVIVITTDRR